MFKRLMEATSVVLSLLLLTSCADLEHSKRDATAIHSNNQSERARNEGYSLLYELMSDEKDVSKLLIVKKEKPDVTALIKEISQKAANAQKQLEAFSKEDAHLNLKLKNLPLLEAKTRESIGRAKAKELLLSKGEKFELRLLLTQVEALTYASHLSRTVRDIETVAQRQAFLGQLSEQLADLQQRVINLISSRYVRETRKRA